MLCKIPRGLGSGQGRFKREKIYVYLRLTGIKIAGRNSNDLRYANNTTLMAKSEEELKSLLMKVKEVSGKSWLKAQHSEK